VYKLKKALYGLKQAPRAWYERLTKFLINQGYKKGGTDKTLFVKKDKGRLMIAQIYVDDIVFGGISNQMVLKGFLRGVFQIIYPLNGTNPLERILIKSLITNQQEHILKHFKDYVYTS